MEGADKIPPMVPLASPSIALPAISTTALPTALMVKR
jgi:hypothetical protein